MKALDLFCGGGGVCIGLMQAGFEVVVGIDHKPHPHYPGTFIQADIHHLPVDVMDFDFVWASPPCQRFSIASGYHGSETRLRHPDLIPETRKALDGHPFTCIENVPGAPIRADLVLTGSAVGLHRIERRRYFELSFWPGLAPKPVRLPRHVWESGQGICITTSMCASSHFYPRKRAGLPGRVPNWEAKEVMGILEDVKMTQREVGEAVPPPYAQWIGQRVMELLQ